MSDMKCPFCQQELEIVFEQAGHSLEEAYLLCNKCNLRAERKVWQELIRTRKALDVAVDALNRILNHATAIDTARCRAEMALDQIKTITALEQKD